MNKLARLFLALSAGCLLLATSCHKNDEDTPPAPRVAMLAYGVTFDDKAFLQNCKTGLVKASADFGLECAWDIDTTTDRYTERLEKYCDQGFDMIIAVGYMWSDAVAAAAVRYPATKFVLVDSGLPEYLENAASILFDVDQAAYPLGFLAAWWAENSDAYDPAVGYVGALPIPQIRQFTEPFLNGVQRYNDEYGSAVKTYGAYAGSFLDAGLGAHLSDSLIGRGATVIFGVGGQAGSGALLAARDRGKTGIGVDVDQCISIPELSTTLLSSAMKGLDVTIYAVMRAFINGSFPGGGVYSGNLRNGGVQPAPYHHFETMIPDGIRNEIEEIKAGIISGAISTGWNGKL